MKEDISPVVEREQGITAEQMSDPEFVEELVVAGRVPRFYMSFIDAEGEHVLCLIPRNQCGFGEEVSRSTKPFYFQSCEGGGVIPFEMIRLEPGVGREVQDVAYSLVDINEAAMNDEGFKIWFEQREEG